MSNQRPTLTAAFADSLTTLNLSLFFESFPDTSVPEKVSLPPSTLFEARETLRLSLIRHSKETLSNLTSGQICSLHLQRVLPSKELIQDLTEHQFLNIFSVNFAAFQQDLRASNILPDSKYYIYWTLRAKGYTMKDYETFTPDQRVQASQGIPLAAPRIPSGSHDVLFYLLWTRRQFLVYMVEVDEHCNMYDNPNYDAFVPSYATWKEPLISAEFSLLKTYADNGFKKFAYQMTHHSYRTEFPKLPPMNITEEIDFYSIDRHHENFKFVDTNPHVCGGPKELFSVALYQEIYLRIYFLHCMNVLQLLRDAPDLQKARWFLAARDPVSTVVPDVVEEAICLTYLHPFATTSSPKMFDLIVHLLQVIKLFKVDPSANPLQVQFPDLPSLHYFSTPHQKYTTTPSTGYDTEVNQTAVDTSALFTRAPILHPPSCTPLNYKSDSVQHFPVHPDTDRKMDELGSNFADLSAKYNSIIDHLNEFERKSTAETHEFRRENDHFRKSSYETSESFCHFKYGIMDKLKLYDSKFTDLSSKLDQLSMKVDAINSPNRVALPLRHTPSLPPASISRVDSHPADYNSVRANVFFGTTSGTRQHESVAPVFHATPSVCERSLSPLSSISSPDRSVYEDEVYTTTRTRDRPAPFHLSGYDPTSTAGHLANQGAKQFEPTGIIHDHHSLRKWIVQWDLYKHNGGTKSLKMLLSRPQGTTTVSNFSSYCAFLTEAEQTDEDIILTTIKNAFGTPTPTIAAAENILSKLEKFKTDSQATEFKAQIYSQYANNYSSTIYENRHVYSPSDDKEIIKQFLKNLHPEGLKNSWNLTQYTDLPLKDFLTNFRARVNDHSAIHKRESLLFSAGKSKLEKKSPNSPSKSPTTGGSTSGCSNCGNPHSIDQCRVQCKKHPSEKHSGQACPDRSSDKKKVAKIASSISPSPLPSTLPDVTVIFDSGSGVNTVPSDLYLSTNRDSHPMTPTLELRTASDQTFTPTSTGNFRGLNSYLVPAFSDIIISLSDLLDSGNFAIVTNSEMTIIDSNQITMNLLQEFKNTIMKSVKCVAPVLDGIYQTSLRNLPSDLVTSNSYERLVNVIHRYETAKFHTISDLVLFFHDLLGHPSIDTMLDIVSSSSIDNLPSELTTAAIRKYFPFNCPTCPASQLAKRPAALLLSNATQLPGEEFEVDFKGPWTDAAGTQIPSFSNNKYSFTALDVNADFAYASFARTTKNPLQYLERLRIFALKKTGNRLKVLRVGDEFMKNKAVHAWADQPEIKVTLLPAIPYEHDRLTKVERIHRTMQDMVNKCLHGKPHLGPKYWEKAYRHCIDLYNIRPRAALANQSPYVIYYNRPYDFKTNPIFPFGSVIMGHIPLESQTAMSGRSNEMFFEGVAHDYNNGIKLYNPETKQTVTRHSYAFVDTKEPTVNTYVIPDTPSPPVAPLQNSVIDAPPSPIERGPIPDFLPSIPTLDSTLPSPSLVEGGPISDPIPLLQEGGPTPLDLLADTPIDDINCWTHSSLSYQQAPKYLRPAYDNIGRKFTDLNLDIQFEITDICRSSAPNFKTSYTFKFYDTSMFPSPPSLDALYEYEQVDSLLQDTNYRFDTKSFPYLRRRVIQLKTQKKLGIPTIPISIEQAQRHEYSTEFMSALDEEVSSLWGMSTWKAFGDDPKTIPLGRLIGSKVIFDIVYNPDGTFKKFKARLVARGDQLKNGDPNNFAGTVKSETMRMLLAIVAELDLDHDSLDVKTAFLYPSLKPDDRTWLRRPKGLTDQQMPAIVELLKSIYGLPKASQYFEEYLSEHLLKIGFKRTISDKQLFMLRDDNGNICYLSTHVDDIFLASTKDSGLNDWVREQLSKVFTLTHRPNTSVHLGLVIERDRPNKWLKISQPHYIQEILARFGMSSPAYTVDSPMSESYLRDMHLYATDPVLEPTQITLFQEMVGCYQYLTDQSRPDLKYSVNQLSRRSSSPTNRDLKAARRVLVFLSQTASEGIVFCTYGFSFELYVTVDVSYNCYNDSKSHTGFSFHLGRFSGAVFAFSRKQSIIADSSTSAEFIGTHAACQQIAWTQNLLSEMGIPMTSPTVVYQDNMSTIKLIHHKGNEARTKHIDLRYNLIREFFQKKRIVVKYLPTDHMIADMLTKPLPGPAFSRLSTRLLNLSPPNDMDLTLI